MFRILQALEREPVNLATTTSKHGTLVRRNTENAYYMNVFWTTTHPEYCKCKSLMRFRAKGSAGNPAWNLSFKQLLSHILPSQALTPCLPSQEPSEKPAKRENPHKYLLYKPTFSQLYTFLSASFKVSLHLTTPVQSALPSCSYCRLSHAWLSWRKLLLLLIYFSSPPPVSAFFKLRWFLEIASSFYVVHLVVLSSAKNDQSSLPLR